MTNLDSALKSRDFTLPTKAHIVKAMVFPVVMHRCEILTIKKVECQRMDAFELWCWNRHLNVHWTARRLKQLIKGNQPWKFTGRTDAEASIFWPPDVKSRDTGKDPDAGNDWRQREKNAQRMRWSVSITDSAGHEFEQTLGESEKQWSLEGCSPRGCKRWTRLCDQTTTTWHIALLFFNLVLCRLWRAQFIPFLSQETIKFVSLREAARGSCLMSK